MAEASFPLSVTAGARYHLIGIGGIGMSAIARLLMHKGARVSGSDVKRNAITDGLEKSGITVFCDHSRDNVQTAEFVIYSSAIQKNNPELQEAHHRSIPVMKRAQALAMLMEDKVSVTVTGSHGKTTTASLAGYMLKQAGCIPSIAVGGILQNLDSNASFGEGKFFVAEADESDGSFLFFHPDYSIITNIDREHLDYYKDFDSILSAYRAFIDQTKITGCLFYCVDDPHLAEIVKGRKQKLLSFGIDSSADSKAERITFRGLSSEFDCRYYGKVIGRFRLSLGGVHNILNALSVIALGKELGIGEEVIAQALAGFRGTRRRLEIKSRTDRCMIVDDYAHHPSEIKATLAAIRKVPHKRIVVVFQPHRYTRTKLLLKEFATCFAAADVLVLTDIYSAGEEPIAGISSRVLCEKIKSAQPEMTVEYLKKENIASRVSEIARDKDIILTLGAGDITYINDELVARITGDGVTTSTLKALHHV